MPARPLLFLLLLFATLSPLVSQSPYATLVFPSRQAATSRIIVAGQGEFGLSSADKKRVDLMSEKATYVLYLPLDAPAQVAFKANHPALQPPPALLRPDGAYQLTPDGWQDDVDFPVGHDHGDTAWVRVNEYELAAYGQKGVGYSFRRVSDGTKGVEFGVDLSAVYRWIPVPPGTYGLFWGDRPSTEVVDGKSVEWSVAAGGLYTLGTHSGTGWILRLWDVGEFTLVNK